MMIIKDRLKEVRQQVLKALVKEKVLYLEAETRNSNLLKKN